MTRSRDSSADTGREPARAPAPAPSGPRVTDVGDADVAREIGVEGAPDPQARDPGRSRQRRDLPQGVHARVGAAGAGQAGLGTEPPTRGLQQDPLHRTGAGLDLPAVVVGAVVGQHQTEARTERRYCGGGWRRGLRAGTNVSHTTATRRKRMMSITISHDTPGSTVGTT